MHTVEPGDSCDDIAYMCGVTRERLEQLNLGLCPVAMVGREYCCNEGGLPAQCSSDRPCPLGACCDANGQCGFSEQHCGAGCQRDCNPLRYPYEDNEYPARVGYFDALSHRRPCVNSTILSISQYYTHVIYAHVYLSSNHTVGITTDDDNVLTQFATSSTKYKKIVSIKDENVMEYRSTFSSMLDGNVDAFVKSVSQVVDAYRLDGIDLYWPHAGSEHRGSSASDMPKYIDLMVQLRHALGYNKIISVAVPASYKYLKNFDLHAIQSRVDYITYMTYDMHGDQGEYYTGTRPVLRSHFDRRDVMASVRMLATARVAKSKVLLGVATHARTFVQADPGCNESSCEFTDSMTPPGTCTMDSGVLSRAEISRLSNIRHQWSDNEAGSSVINYGDNYVAYIPSTDEVWSSRAYAASLGLAGSVDWTIDLEADYAPKLDPNCRLDRIRNSVDVDYLPSECRAYGGAAMLYNFNAEYYNRLKALVEDTSHDSQIEYYVTNIADQDTPNPKTAARVYLGIYEALRDALLSKEPGGYDWVEVAVGSSLGVLSMKYMEQPLRNLYSVVDKIVDDHKRGKVVLALTIVSIVLPIVTLGVGGAVAVAGAIASAGLNVASTAIMPPDDPLGIILTALGFALDVGGLASGFKSLSAAQKMRKMAGATERLLVSEGKELIPEVVHEAKRIKYSTIGVCR